MAFFKLLNMEVRRLQKDKLEEASAANSYFLQKKIHLPCKKKKKNL